MKKIILKALCLLIVACDGSNGVADKKQLPWVIEQTSTGETTVMGVSPGNISLRDFARHFNQLAEVRLFESPDSELVLEAYLGKTKVGQFDARIIAELDAPEAFLEAILASGKDRKPTPNNYWQYNLDDEQLVQALSLNVWRFMYIPIANYEARQINFFGSPETTEQVNDTAEYRYYPEKGLVILWDSEGKETFYYSSPKDYERLAQAIQKSKRHGQTVSAAGEDNE